jgi:hypothetical protein
MLEQEALGLGILDYRIAVPWQPATTSEAITISLL